MSSTSPTPSAARPPTSRTGGRSPSPSSPFSKGATTLVTMGTVMTTWSFPRIRMGRSGSKTPLSDVGAEATSQDTHIHTHTFIHFLSHTNKKTHRHLTHI